MHTCLLMFTHDACIRKKTLKVHMQGAIHLSFHILVQQIIHVMHVIHVYCMVASEMLHK